MLSRFCTQSVWVPDLPNLSPTGTQFANAFLMVTIRLRIFALFASPLAKNGNVGFRDFVFICQMGGMDLQQGMAAAYPVGTGGMVPNMGVSGIKRNEM